MAHVIFHHYNISSQSIITVSLFLYVITGGKPSARPWTVFAQLEPLAVMLFYYYLCYHSHCYFIPALIPSVLIFAFNVIIIPCPSLCRVDHPFASNISG
jgi:hypothetical protein